MKKNLTANCEFTTVIFFLHADAERIPLYIGLTAVSGIGTLCMFFLRSHKKSPPEPSLLEEEENDSQEYVEQEPNTAVNVVR